VAGVGHQQDPVADKFDSEGEPYVRTGKVQKVIGL
jgi:hypothetical protein